MNRVENKTKKKKKDEWRSPRLSSIAKYFKGQYYELLFEKKFEEKTVEDLIEMNKMRSQWVFDKKLISLKCDTIIEMFRILEENGLPAANIMKLTYENAFSYMRGIIDIIPKIRKEEKIKSIIELYSLSEKYKEQINKIENTDRTYKYSLMLRIKELELKTSNDKPKPTQAQLVVMANRELRIYDEEELRINGKPTEFCLSIKNSYKAQKNKL